MNFKDLNESFDKRYKGRKTTSLNTLFFEAYDEDEENIDLVLDDYDEEDLDETFGDEVVDESLDDEDDLEESAFSLRSGHFRNMNKYKAAINHINDSESIEPLVNALDKVEEKTNCDITWDFERNEDGRLTAGIDVKVNDNSSDATLDIIEKTFENNGFVLDKELGYTTGPQRLDKGNEWHYQIIQVDDANESLEESIIDEAKIRIDNGMETSDKDLVRPVISALDDVEKKYPCWITWNFGRNANGEMTAGIDISFEKDAEDTEFESAMADMMNAFEDNGFTLDASIGYADGPKEHVFGKGYHYQIIEKQPLTEDTVKEDGKWVNRGKEGTHGKFKTKKAADSQRKAMFANGYKESLKESQCYPGFCDDDDFFTREEIDEFANDVADNLTDILGADCYVAEVYMEGPKKLVMEVDCGDDTLEAMTSIDMRRIRKPSDLYRYKDVMIDQLVSEYEKNMEIW